MTVARAELDDDLRIIAAFLAVQVGGDVGSLRHDEPALSERQKVFGRLADLLVERRSGLVVEEGVRDVRLRPAAQALEHRCTQLGIEHLRWRVVLRVEPRHDGIIREVVRAAVPGRFAAA